VPVGLFGSRRAAIAGIAAMIKKTNTAQNADSTVVHEVFAPLVETPGRRVY